MRAEILHKSCLGKKPYKTDAAAQRKIRAKAKEGIALRSYWCEICLRFHLTKSGVKQPKPASAEPVIQQPQPIPEPPRKHFIVPRPPGPRPTYQATIDLARPAAKPQKIDMAVFKELARKKHPTASKKKIKKLARNILNKHLREGGFSEVHP